MFYYIRSGAASFHVRRSHVPYVDVDYDTQKHSVNCEALVHCNFLITSDSEHVTTSSYNYFRFKHRVIFYVTRLGY